MTSKDLRDALARSLDWNEARADFGRATADLSPELRGAHATGFEHTPWQLLEHVRRALADLLDFAVNPAYAHALTWPDDYWPPAEPPDADAWDTSVTAVHADIARLQSMVRDPAVDLLAPVPTGTAAQTFLRTVLLVIDHNAYHVGQLVAVRQALGAWPPPQA